MWPQRKRCGHTATPHSVAFGPLHAAPLLGRLRAPPRDPDSYQFGALVGTPGLREDLPPPGTGEQLPCRGGHPFDADERGARLARFLGVLHRPARLRTVMED